MPTRRTILLSLAGYLSSSILAGPLAAFEAA